MKVSAFIQKTWWVLLVLAGILFIIGALPVGHLYTVKAEACTAMEQASALLWLSPLLNLLLLLLVILVLVAFSREREQRIAAEGTRINFLNALMHLLPSAVPFNWTGLEKMLGDDDNFVFRNATTESTPQEILRTEQAALGAIHCFEHEVAYQTSKLASKQARPDSAWAEVLMILNTATDMHCDLRDAALEVCNNLQVATAQMSTAERMQSLTGRTRTMGKQCRDMRLSHLVPEDLLSADDLDITRQEMPVIDMVEAIIKELPNHTIRNRQAFKAQQDSYENLIDSAREGHAREVADLKRQHQLSRMCWTAETIAKLWVYYPSHDKKDAQALTDSREMIREAREALVQSLFAQLRDRKISSEQLEEILSMLTPEMITKVANNWATSGMLVNPDTLENVHPHGKRLVGFAGLFGTSRRCDPAGLDEDDVLDPKTERGS